MKNEKKPKKKNKQTILNALQEGVWELLLFMISFAVGIVILFLLGEKVVLTRLDLETVIFIGFLALCVVGGIVLLIIYMVKHWKK